MTASSPPHPAPTSSSDVADSSTERDESGSVNPEQERGAGGTGAVAGASPHSSGAANETEVVASGGGVLFDDGGGEQPGAEAQALDDDVTPRAALVRPADGEGGSATAERWLRGTTSRRLRLIDRRLRIALTLQGVVVAVVLGLWLLGKLSWNHDPVTSQRFRPVELPALTNRAQNAALEFHHDLVTGEFGQARLLVVEEAEELVEDAAATCQPAAPCASKERVFTRATLLQSAGQDARAFVESFAADGRPVGDATYVLSHASGRWLVTERVTR